MVFIQEVIDLEYESIGTPWIALYFNDNNETYFDSFGVELNPKELKKFIGNKKYYNTYLRYTNADLIISLYLCVRMKTLP